MRTSSCADAHARAGRAGKLLFCQPRTQRTQRTPATNETHLVEHGLFLPDALAREEHKHVRGRLAQVRVEDPNLYMYYTSI